jgi:hypothetical protein
VTRAIVTARVDPPRALASLLLEADWTPEQVEQYLAARPRGAAPTRPLDDFEYAQSGALKRRAGSTRVFTSETLSIELLTELLQAGIGRGRHRSYACAGGVSALQIGLLRLASTESRDDPGSGLYSYQSDRGDLHRSQLLTSTEMHSIVDMRDTHDPQALLLLGIDMKARNHYLHCYDLALIEVGQCLQSVETAARRLDIGTCPLGGVYPDQLVSLVLPHFLTPLAPVVAVALGRPTSLEG